MSIPCNLKINESPTEQFLACGWRSTDFAELTNNRIPSPLPIPETKPIRIIHYECLNTGDSLSKTKVEAVILVTFESTDPNGVILLETKKFIKLTGFPIMPR